MTARRIDAAEAITNAAVGFAVSWAFTRFALPLWGLHPNAGQALTITAAFFLLSTARAYVLRRLFRRVG